MAETCREIGLEGEVLRRKTYIENQKCAEIMAKICNYQASQLGWDIKYKAINGHVIGTSQTAMSYKKAQKMLQQLEELDVRDSKKA